MEPTFSELTERSECYKYDHPRNGRRSGKEY
jgi:hypothetical protein